MNYRFIFISLTIFLNLFNACGTPKNEKISAKQNIMNLLDKQVEDWNRGDITEFMQGYWKSDSLRFYTKNGVSYSWNTVLNNYKKAFPNVDDMGKLHFKTDSIYLDHAPLISVAGQWFLYKQDTVSGRFVLLFKEIPGAGWKIVEDHTW